MCFHLSVEEIDTLRESLQERLNTIKAAGGISLLDLQINQNLEISDYWYDPLTEYYVPNQLRFIDSPIPTNPGSH